MDWLGHYWRNSMDISKIKEAIESIFSSDGLQIAKFKFFCPPEISTGISKTDEGVSINFLDKLPYVKTRKLLIPITIEVEGLTLRENGGTVKLKYLPDFDFSYDFANDEKTFGAAPQKKFDLTNIKDQIATQYPDQERQKIAKLALKYANEWSILASASGIDIKDCGKNSRKKLTEDCKAFVRDNIIKSQEIEAKSAILTFIVLYFVLPAIISWVVKKFLDNFFN